jgi:hypothetical protein
MRSWFWLAAVLLVLAAPLEAQGHANVNEMVLEVMRTDLGKDRESMAMWLPQEFFLAAGLSQAPGLDRQKLEQELDFLSDYAVFMVQAKTKGEDGPASLTTAQLRAIATLADEDGKTLKPLSELPSRVEELLNVMRQGIASKGNTEFRLLVFPGREHGSKRLFISPTRRGTVTFKLAKTTEFPGLVLTWKTPLSSFVKPSACAKCKQPLQAAWSFCPWCAEPAGSKQP